MRLLPVGLAALLLLACGSEKQSKEPNSTSGTGGSSGSGASAGANSTGGSSGGTSSGGSGGEAGSPIIPPPTCANGKSTLPEGAPNFEVGQWTDISPDLPYGSNNGVAVLSQGMAMDWCNQSTIYVTVDRDPVQDIGGIYRSTDAGGSWLKVGNFDSPINVRVNPRDPLHLYICDGVAGGTHGFWVTKDGGQNWYRPAGFNTAAMEVRDDDVYHVEPDPADFNHVLLTFHYYWHGGDNAGIFESFDGGETFSVIQPDPGWVGAGGYNVFFLYNPTLGIGNNRTWLYGTQGKGYWRTTDAGQTWTQVSTVDMQHGGATIYYKEDGTLYISGNPSNMRSRDNGVTWENIGPTGGYLSIIGDGNYLYSGPIYGPAAFSWAPEDDDNNWTMLDGGMTQFRQGPFEMAYSPDLGLLYASCNQGGVWAMKVPTP